MHLQTRRRLRRGLIGGGVLAAIALTWDSIPVARRLEQSTLDWRYRKFNSARVASKDVVVIDIDEQSIKLLAPSYGRWPWPRHIYKELAEFISIGEPAGIYFDLLFTEAQTGTDDDALLAQASARLPISHAMVALQTPATELKKGEIVPLPEGFKSRFALGTELQGFPHPRSYRDYLLPAPAYLEKTRRVHAVNSLVDDDGNTRRTPLLLKYGTSWVPTLALAAVLSTLEEPSVSYQNGELRLSSKGQLRHRIPLDADGYMPLHFYDTSHEARREPLAPIIESALKLQSGEIEDPAKLKVDPFAFKGKIVMIGGSAAGLEDLKTTPLDHDYPGVMTHATAASNILLDEHLGRAPLVARLAIALLIIALTYGSVLGLSSLGARLALPGIAWVATVTVAVVAFQQGQLWMDIALPSFLFFGSLLDSLGYMSFVEGREKKKMKDTLSKYLPTDVINEMIANGHDLKAEIGKKTELSILFSDIRGFTSLSERLAPETVVAILNEYLGQMSEVVFTERGTLDKFIGDAIMAFWGAPLPDSQHAERSVKCALRMHKALAAMKQAWASERRAPGVDLQIGIGVNTGEVIVGNIGSDRKLDYTVIGDNVNLASRLEGLTKYYHVGVVIGERTEELVRGQIVSRIVDKVRVMGKANPVRIYEPLCETTAPEADEARRLAESFDQAWHLYEKGEFQEALARFLEISHLRPGGDGLSQLYVERCEHFTKEAPAVGWDGTFVAKSK